jgi:hypothetical protein
VKLVEAQAAGSASTFFFYDKLRLLKEKEM